MGTFSSFWGLVLVSLHSCTWSMQRSPAVCLPHVFRILSICSPPNCNALFFSVTIQDAAIARGGGVQVNPAQEHRCPQRPRVRALHLRRIGNSNSKSIGDGGFQRWSGERERRWRWRAGRVGRLGRRRQRPGGEEPRLVSPTYFVKIRTICGAQACLPSDIVCCHAAMLPCYHAAMHPVVWRFVIVAVSIDCFSAF